MGVSGRFARVKYIISLVAGIPVNTYTSYTGLLLKKFSIAFIVAMKFTISLNFSTLALKGLKGMLLNSLSVLLFCCAPTILKGAIGFILIRAASCAEVTLWAGCSTMILLSQFIINTKTMILASFAILHNAPAYVKINAILSSYAVLLLLTALTCGFASRMSTAITFCRIFRGG